MAYKPTRRFITEDGISIEYELRKISTELAATGSGTITGVTAGTAITGGGTTGTVTVNFAPSELSAVTVASDDKIVIADTSDSDAPKTVTAASIAALASANPAGSDHQVQWNDGGSFGADANFTYDGAKLTINQEVFAAAKMQTGQTSFTQEPWADSTIMLGNYGSVGTQGSYRTSLSWNYERGSDNNFHHLDVNSYSQAGDFSIGNTGFIWSYADDYENNHTTNPPAVANMLKDGQLNAYKEGADGGIVLGRAYGGYVGLRTAGMAEDSGDEYIIMSNGQHTFISAGGGTGNAEGDVYIRAGGNDSSCQIFLDTSENDIRVTGSLGVGTSAVAGNLTVASQNRQISICDSGSTNYSEIRAHGNGNLNSYAHINYNAYSHRFLTEGTYRAEINNAGIFRNEFIPAFRVAYTQNSGGYLIQGDGTLVFNGDSGSGLYDNGNNYNTSTGVFTAPCTGYYWLSVTVFKYTTYDNDTNCYWGIKTSNGEMRSNHGTKGQDGGQTVSGLFYLDINDTAYVYNWSSGKDIYTWRSQHYNSFQGCLVG